MRTLFLPGAIDNITVLHVSPAFTKQFAAPDMGLVIGNPGKGSTRRRFRIL